MLYLDAHIHAHGRKWVLECLHTVSIRSVDLFTSLDIIVLDLIILWHSTSIILRIHWKCIEVNAPYTLPALFVKLLVNQSFSLIVYQLFLGLFATSKLGLIDATVNTGKVTP